MSSLYLGQEIKGEKKLLILKYFDMTKSEAYVNYWQYYSVKSQCGVVWTKQQMWHLYLQLVFKKKNASTLSGFTGKWKCQDIHFQSVLI